MAAMGVCLLRNNGLFAYVFFLPFGIMIFWKRNKSVVPEYLQDVYQLDKLDDILHEFYHDWLDCDVPLGDSMQYCVAESIATLTKYMGKKKNHFER